MGMDFQFSTFPSFPRRWESTLPEKYWEAWVPAFAGMTEKFFALGGKIHDTMNPMVFLILFVFGLIFGSFLNVVALRYDGEHFLFDPAMIGGRSRCPKCGRQLRWFELVPVLSFIAQGARCRGCKTHIGMQYPVVELLTGIVFAAVPARLAAALSAQGFFLGLYAALWILVFVLFILVSYVDIRLNIIPDECHWMLGALTLILIVVSVIYLGPTNHSFLGPYAWIAGLQGSILVAHLMGAVLGFAFFEILVLVTRGGGMGMGDVKFALPLGFLFGWPDVLAVLGFAFVIGAMAGIIGIMLKRKTMKATLPFVPFLAVGAAVVFFWGSLFVGWYVKLLGI
jgi:leader peptidase (prepilin peptidase)/N-methyltransferase